MEATGAFHVGGEIGDDRGAERPGAGAFDAGLDISALLCLCNTQTQESRDIQTLKERWTELRDGKCYFTWSCGAKP